MENNLETPKKVKVVKPRKPRAKKAAPTPEQVRDDAIQKMVCHITELNTSLGQYQQAVSRLGDIAEPLDDLKQEIATIEDELLEARTHLEQIKNTPLDQIV